MGLCWTIMDYFRLSRTISDFDGLSGTNLNYIGLFGTIWDYLRLSWKICDYLRLSETICEYMWLSETIWDYLRLSWTRVQVEAGESKLLLFWNFFALTLTLTFTSSGPRGALAPKNVNSTGKTSRVLRGGVSEANMGHVMVNCGGGGHKNMQLLGDNSSHRHELWESKCKKEKSAKSV